MHSVVLAFDGDEAGDEATNNALLNVIGVEDDQRDFVRAFSLEGREFRRAIKLLSNQSLSDEYRFWSRLSTTSKMVDWIRELGKEYSEECMALINHRAGQVSNTYGTIKGFNAENSITSVLSAHGFSGVPGRSIKCPVHDDSSPSLSISKDDGRAYCFNQSCDLWHDGYGVDAYELNKILSG